MNDASLGPRYKGMVAGHGKPPTTPPPPMRGGQVETAVSVQPPVQPPKVRFAEPTTEAERIAILLMTEWERIEGRPVNSSFVRNFYDLGRVVEADRERWAGDDGK